MEEEVLLDMYRNSWDEFLEAYKQKNDQNVELIKLVGEYIETLESDNHKKQSKDVRARLGRILES